MQQEPSARSGNDTLLELTFPSDDKSKAAKEKIEPFHIRFPKLSPLVVKLRSRIQVELHVTYQAHPFLDATS